MGAVCGVLEATWSFPGSFFGLMAVSTMRFGVSCASFEGPPRQSKDSFQCYLEYFPRVHRLHWHEGYIFPEGLLGGSGKPFGNHWRGLGVSSGVPGSLLVVSWHLLRVSQGVLETCSGSVLVMSCCILLKLLLFFRLDIIAYTGEIKFFDNIRS